MRPKLRFLILLLSAFWAFTAIVALFWYSENEKRFAENVHSNMQLAVWQYHIGVSEGSDAASIVSRDIRAYFPDVRFVVFTPDNRLHSYVFGQNTKDYELIRTALKVKDNIDRAEGFSIFHTESSPSGWGICSFRKFSGYTVCAMQPYMVNYKEILRLSMPFYITIIGISLLLSVLSYVFTLSLRRNIDRMKSFIERARNGEHIDHDTKKYPGEIGRIYTDVTGLYSELQDKADKHEREKEIALLDVEEKNKMKRELTNNINHELKTPVASISGYIETLLSNPDLKDSMRISFLQKCFAQTERLASLLRDVTTISRLDETGVTFTEKEFVDINRIMQNISSDMALQPENQRLRVNINFSSPTYVYGSPSLIQSIFQNLANNASSYSGGRDIFVRIIAETQDYYTFTFADNGIGVDSRHLPHLFERFYRADKGRSRKMGGTGLGLAIVKNAVTHHGGTIKVELGEYGGLLFTFTLPKNKGKGDSAIDNKDNKDNKNE